MGEIFTTNMLLAHIHNSNRKRGAAHMVWKLVNFLCNNFQFTEEIRYFLALTNKVLTMTYFVPWIALNLAIVMSLPNSRNSGHGYRPWML